VQRKTGLLVSALERDARFLARFWSTVEKDAGHEACWRWTGIPRGGGSYTFTIGRHSIAPARVAWYTATGELPSGGKMVHLCGEERCVRPEHLAWALSRLGERVLDARADGYVSLSGTPVPREERVSLSTPRVLRLIGATAKSAA
jgi:hypothetical protein